MKKIRSISVKNTGIATHIGVGILLALTCAFLMSILLTIAVENETLQLSAAPTVIIGIHAISVFIGSMLSITLEKGRVAIVAGIVTAGYLITLLCINMLIFSSGFESIGTTMISALAGGLLSVLIKGKFAAKKKHRIKVRSR